MSRLQRLFDTGAFFDLYKGRQRSRPYFDSLLAGHLQGYVSTITVAEIWRGIRPHELFAHDALLAVFIVLPLNIDAAKLAGLWMQNYQAEGLGWMDALIVATAQPYNLPVLTRDDKLATCLKAEATFEVY